MTLPTHSPTLSDVFTRYAYNKVGGREYKDNKYKNRPLLKLLNENKKSSGGSENLVLPVNLGTSANGGSLSRNESFDITGDVNETWARYSWSTVHETIFISWWDLREANGNQFKMESILDSRIAETGENLEDTLVTQLAQTTKAQSDDMNSILECVATSGAFGNLNPATSGQEVWASETEATINWSVEGIGRSRELQTKIEDNKGKPEVYLLPVQFFNETCEIGDSALVINQDASTRGGTKIADLGMRVPYIQGLPVIHDPAWDTAQTATGVLMDLSCMFMVSDPQWDMYMYPFKDTYHLGKLGQASVELKVCQLVCDSRRAQGSLTSIS